MKKKYFKKSLSLIMTVIMIMSCWVFVAPTEVKAAALEAASSLYIKSLLNGINTNIDTTMTTVIGKFKSDGMEGDENASWHVSQYGSQHYKNIYYSPTVDINGYSVFWGSDVISGIDSVRVYYPETVMLYDGSTKPQMGVVACLDGASGGRVRAVSLYLNANANDLVITDHWKGHTTANLAHIINMHNGSYKFANTYDEHSSYKINTEKNGEWYFYASDLRFDGTLSSTEFVRTITPQWGFYGGKRNTANRYTQTASKNIYVMNIKGYRDLLTTINTDKTNITNKAGQYTPESVKTYVNAANAILNLNPKNVSQSGSAAATWGTNMSTAYTNYVNAKNGLKNREYEVTYDNMFSLADWRYSASSETSGNVTVDLNAGKVTVKHPNDSGEYVTTHSGSSSNANTRNTNYYAMPVVGGQEYTFKYTTDHADTQMFAFFYDANGGHTGTYGAYNLTVKNGTGQATFKAPDNATQMEIRFDNNTGATTANFWDIMVYPATLKTEKDVDNWTTRPIRTLYAYNASVGTLPTPVRRGYIFNGWMEDTDGDGIGDAAAPTGNITSSRVLYSTWTPGTMDVGYNNLFSLSAWANSNSSVCSNTSRGSIAYDLDAGTITAITTKDGEIYSNNSSGSGDYQMAVEPNTEYIFTADVDLEGSGNQGQMFVFFYNASGSGLSGAIYNGSTQSASHIGIYPTSDGEASIIFTTPADCTKMAIRIGATVPETTATYSNIGVFKKSDYDDFAKDYEKIREPFNVDETVTLIIPERDGYVFAGWETEDGEIITSTAGLTENTTVYATWTKKWTVTYYDGDNNAIATQEVENGKSVGTLPTVTPTKEADETNSYEFWYWYANGTEFTKDTIITGDLKVYTVFNNIPHSNFVYVLEKTATCDANATVFKSCGECGYVFGNGSAVTYNPDEDVNAAEHTAWLAKGHDFTGGILDNSSTGNTDADTHEVKCIRYSTCGQTTTQTHTWAEKGTDGANCVTHGTVHWSCACGEEKTTVGSLAPDVHENTSIINDKEATCLVAGYTGDTYCNDCKEIVKYGEEIEALGHSFTNYVSNNDATCTEDGTKTAKCDRCDATDTIEDTGSAKGHNWADKGTDLHTAADCENDAVYYQTCETCGISAKDDTTNTGSTWTDVGSKWNHKFDGDYVTNNNGTHVQKCTNAGCTATGNQKDCTYGKWTTDDADTHSHTCERCGYTPAGEAHDWSAWKSTDEYNNTQAGQHSRECSVCGRVETEDCKYTDVETKVTCTADGFTTHTCSCGHKYITSGTKATGHNYTGEVKSYNNGQHNFLCVNGCGTYGFETIEGARTACEYKYTNNKDGEHQATCKDCSYTFAQSCSGGTATCTAPAVCEKCNANYGETAPHSFKGAAVQLDGDFHAYLCEYCGDSTNIYGVGENVGGKEACSGGTATCTTKATCEKCGDYHGELNASAHKWGAWTNIDGTETHERVCEYNEDHTETGDCYSPNPSVIPADCEAQGYTLNACEFCDHEWKTGYTEPLGHDWSAWTSNNDGTHTRVCRDTTCKYGENDTAKTEIASCTEENADAVVTEPKCLEGGYTTYTCKDCGYEWVDDYTEATGHSYLKQTKKTDATYLRTNKDCTTDWTYWYCCDNCDVSAETEKDKYDDETALYWVREAATDHKYDKKDTAEDYLAEAATCTTKAKYYYSCSVCGASSKDTTAEKTFENGAVLGHDWENTETYLKSEADCIYNEVYYKECSRCHISSENETGETWEKENTLKGHDFEYENGYTAGVEATCLVDGVVEHYTCKVCNKHFKADKTTEIAADKLTIKALGHDYKDVPAKNATCEEDGYTKHKQCQREECGYRNSDYKVIAATGHDFKAENGYYTDYANGYHAYNCSNCDAYGVDNVKYNAEYDGLDWVIVGGIKCDFTGEFVNYEAEGVHSHKLVCECGNEQGEACADAEPAHVEATCTEDGYYVHTCDVCGFEWTVASDAEEDKAEGHDLKIISNGNGTHSEACSKCDYAKAAEKCSTETPATNCGEYDVCDICKTAFGEAKPHKFTNYVSDNNATCTADGTKTAVCDTCTGEDKATDTVADKGSKLDHDMTEYVYSVDGWKYKPDSLDADSIKEATCHSEGKSISYCNNCSYYKVKIEKADSSLHVWETDENGELVWSTVGGNCSTGVTMINKCSVVGCNKTQVKTEAVPHTWKIVYIQEAGCTEHGYINFVCEVCSFTGCLEGGETVFEGVDYSDKNIVAVGEHAWEKLDGVADDYAAIDGEIVYVDGNGNVVRVEKYPAYNAEGRGKMYCQKCNHIEEVTLAAMGTAPENHKHPEFATVNADGTITYKSTLKTVAAVAPTCTAGGHKAYEECMRCSYSEYIVDRDAFYIAPTGHADNDGNGKCDACKTTIREDESKNCSCICHKESGFMKFIYKILCFFWKLFGMNETCACGHEHY